MKHVKTLKTIILAVSAHALFVGCAGESDPLKKYDVKAEPAHDRESEKQTACIPPFTISLAGGNSNNFGNFTQGLTGSVAIDVVIIGSQYQSLIKNYKVEPDFSNFPASNKPILTFNNGKYSLTWTPSVGIIPSGKQTHTIPFKIAAIISDASDARIIGCGHEDDVQFVVSKDAFVPTLKGNSLKPVNNKIVANEGDEISFSIDAEDLNVTGNQKPEIRIVPDRSSNVENFVADGSKYIDINYDRKPSIERLVQSNVFRFHYKATLDRLPTDKDRLGNYNPNASFVNVCFKYSVLSSTRNESSGYNGECFEVHYTAQPAVFTFDNSDFTAQANVKKEYSFTLSTFNGLSKIQLKDIENDTKLKNLLKPLIGEKSLTCTDTNDGKNSQRCVLSWTPVCTATAKVKTYPKTQDVKLKLTAVTALASSLDKKTKTTTEDLTFQVTETEANCKPQQPATQGATP